MVEIELICNLKLIITLCFMTWSDVAKNDEMNT
jgi:hypothetical protein